MSYKLVYQSTTPAWQTYEGEGEVGIAEWEGNFTIASMALATEEEIANYGGTLLSLRIWRDGKLWLTESVVHGSPGLSFALIFAGIVTLIKMLLPIAIILLIAWGVVSILTGITNIIHGPPPVWNPETGEWEYRPTGGLFSQIGILILIGGVVVGGIYLLKQAKPTPRTA